MVTQTFMRLVNAEEKSLTTGKRVNVAMCVGMGRKFSSPALAGEGDQRSWWRGSSDRAQAPLRQSLRDCHLPSKSRGGELIQLRPLDAETGGFESRHDIVDRLGVAGLTLDLDQRVLGR